MRILGAMERKRDKADQTEAIRINKYLALHGYATRKGADELIAQKQVSLNGKLAVLGDKVGPADVVVVKKQKSPKTYRYVAYNKPIGIVTHSAQKGAQDIAAIISGTPQLRDLFPIGRLDRESHGLILLTDDGRITDRLLNPDNPHEKEYRVKTSLPLRDSFKKYMEAGVDIEGYTTKKCKVKRLGDKSFLITLTEGKKHQIRRMVVALHNTVADLERTRIMTIRLGNVAPGAWRTIEGEELAIFLRNLGL